MSFKKTNKSKSFMSTLEKKIQIVSKKCKRLKIISKAKNGSAIINVVHIGIKVP